VLVTASTHCDVALSHVLGYDSKVRHPDLAINSLFVYIGQHRRVSARDQFSYLEALQSRVVLTPAASLRPSHGTLHSYSRRDALTWPNVSEVRSSGEPTPGIVL
jgi:hypothetical protein